MRTILRFALFALGLAASPTLAAASATPAANPGNPKVAS